MAAKKCQLKQQSVVAMLLLTMLCLHDKALASPSSFSSTVSRANAEISKALQIIATIPSMFGPGDPQWTRGEEILPGAQLAINEINNTSDLLSGYKLEIIPVKVPKCELSEGIVPFIEELASNRNNIIGIVGYFCHNIARLLSRIAHSWITHAIQISAAWYPNCKTSRDIPLTILSKLAYNIGTMFAAFLCQVLLVLPKTVPLVVRNCWCMSRCQL